MHGQMNVEKSNDSFDLLHINIDYCNTEEYSTIQYSTVQYSGLWC